MIKTLRENWARQIGPILTGSAGLIMAYSLIMFSPPSAGIFLFFVSYCALLTLVTDGVMFCFHLKNREAQRQGTRAYHEHEHFASMFGWIAIPLFIMAVFAFKWPITFGIMTALMLIPRHLMERHFEKRLATIQD